jgi:hypothetical protein
LGTCPFSTYEIGNQTMDVITKPAGSTLDRLAGLIRHDLERQHASREEWVAATLDLCQHLAEARAQFSANQVFGHWLDENHIEMSHQDRAAAIEMGQHLEEARKVLEVTERKSLRHIHDEEFRFTHVGKTETTIPDSTPQPKQKAKAPKPSKPKQYRQGWVNAIMAALGDKHGLKWTAVNQSKAQAEQLLGYKIPKTFLHPDQEHQFVLDYEQLVLPAKFKKDVEPLVKEAFAPSKQEAFDAAIRAHKRKLDIEFDQRVATAAGEYAKQFLLPSDLKAIADADLVLKGRKGVFANKRDYHHVLRCLHSDTHASMSEQDLNRAFDLIKSKEPLMLAEKDLPLRPSTLPTSVADLLARKKTKR